MYDGRFDGAVGRRVDRLPFVGRDVEALVEARLAGERIAAAAERAGQPAVRRPDRRRRGRQRLAPLDVAADVAQPALEALQQSRSTPNVSSGDDERRGRRCCEMAAFGCALPPAARAFTIAGSFCIARACAGSSAARAPRSLMTPSSD